MNEKPALQICMKKLEKLTNNLFQAITNNIFLNTLNRQDVIDTFSVSGTGDIHHLLWDNALSNLILTISRMIENPASDKSSIEQLIKHLENDTLQLIQSEHLEKETEKINTPEWRIEQIQKLPESFQALKTNYNKRLKKDLEKELETVRVIRDNFLAHSLVKANDSKNRALTMEQLGKTISELKEIVSKMNYILTLTDISYEDFEAREKFSYDFFFKLLNTGLIKNIQDEKNHE